MPDRVRSLVPNAITLLRLVMATGFLAALGLGLRTAESTAFWGNWAVWIFVLAALTDVLDGWLARRWKVVSPFGRVMDPFVDKVLVLGAFIYLASPPFAPHEAGVVPAPVAAPTGISTWMVVLVLARELLVTSIRSVLEAEGVAFGADVWGKIKMLLQSICIPLSLVLAVNGVADPSNPWKVLQLGVVWATVAATAASAVPYVLRGGRLLAGLPRREPRS